MVQLRGVLNLNSLGNALVLSNSEERVGGLHAYDDKRWIIYARYRSCFRILDPVVFGDYPLTMKTAVEDRLPRFTEDERKELKGSLDFIGLNYYTAYYAQNAEAEPNPKLRWFVTDRQANVLCTYYCSRLVIFLSWQT